MIAASVAYSDDKAHNNYWIGVADSKGEYPLAWTPPPDAPLGDAKMLAGASSEGGGGTTVRKFRLSGPGGCS
jgi:hypothetical protein